MKTKNPLDNLLPLKTIVGYLCVGTFLISLFFVMSGDATAAEKDPGLLVGVTDSQTGTGIDSAAIYFDGGYAGVTSETEGKGTLRITDISAGSHTIRITNTGYQTQTKRITFPGETVVRISLVHTNLVSLDPENNNSHAINIVFVPSSTYYRTSDNSKIKTDEYTGNETRFREDVIRIINTTFLDFPAMTDPSIPFPPDFSDRLKFFYYFDPTLSADAFSGCAGSIPDQYWNRVTFSDLTIILYPKYEGWHTDALSQPVGCFEDSGAGHRQMKIPTNRDMVVFHESGHALFGLVDTYCGDTYYFENNPFPNVWSSLDECRASATMDRRDPDQCRVIQQDPSSQYSCTKNFWRWDPDPDIMRTTDGRFGPASTERIENVLKMAGP